MKTFLVVTITCPDRPGIVERITEHVLKHAANWEDSRMARLGGDFAGIILISADPENAALLTESLLSMSDDDTTVTVNSTHEPPPPPADQAIYDLTLAGADHEGIVHKVSAYLAGHGINVESMETEISPAPMSASPLFHMSAVIKVPGTMSYDELNQNLQVIADELGVDIALQHKT